jgi:hypothetical protein
MRPDELPGELSQFGAGDDETDLLVHEPANMWKHRQKWSKLVTLCK